MALHEVRRVPPDASTTPPTRPRGLARIPPGWWVVICLIYLISPIDLMPELILGPMIGLVDDAGILAFAVYNFVLWLRGRRR